ncbi:MAG TPA: PASTA domain-containing protein [Blastocatellia bacterium]|nr:PASTA domain-containing protein [Blastocatellia bacterium]
MSSISREESGGAGRIVWTIARRIAMVIVLALAFFLSAIVTIYILFRTGATRVPPVVGKTETEAQTMAEKAGLRVKIQMRTDPSVPQNVVIETRPAPNSSVKKDTNLTIVVSSGAAGQTSKALMQHPGIIGRRCMALSGQGGSAQALLLWGLVPGFARNPSL